MLPVNSTIEQINEDDLLNDIFVDDYDDDEDGESDKSYDEKTDFDCEDYDSIDTEEEIYSESENVSEAQNEINQPCTSQSVLKNPNSNSKATVKKLAANRAKKNHREVDKENLPSKSKISEKTYRLLYQLTILKKIKVNHQ